MDDDLPLESRPSSSGLFGKLDGELPRIRMSLDTIEGLQREAARAGMSVSELVRTLCDCHVHGIDHIANLAAERVRRVVGNGA